MSNWNGKDLIDYLVTRTWGQNTTTYRGLVLQWINEIQDDLISELPIETFKIKLKKLLPTGQEKINLQLEKPGKPTGSIFTGGGLTEGTSYKVRVTHVIYDEDGRNYIEGESSQASDEQTATATDKTLVLTNISTYDGESATAPTTIYRRVYVSKKASTDTEYGPYYFSQEIQDNTTTSVNVTAEPTSTIEPPEDGEVDQLTSDHMYFQDGNRWLVKDDANRFTRFDPDGSDTKTPYAFDYEGIDAIRIYPFLSSSATTAQRTLSYYAYRRPHAVYYDRTRRIDLPITCRKALVQGVIWKAYAFRDRSGFDTQLNQYEQFKSQLKRKLKRQKGRPSVIRDTTGDTRGFEV